MGVNHTGYKSYGKLWDHLLQVRILTWSIKIYKVELIVDSVIWRSMSRAWTRDIIFLKNTPVQHMHVCQCTSMSVCMYQSCMNMHVNMHVCMYYTYINLCMCLHTYMNVYFYAWRHNWAYVSMCVCMHECTDECMHACLYVFLYVWVPSLLLCHCACISHVKEKSDCHIIQPYAKFYIHLPKYNQLQYLLNMLLPCMWQQICLSNATYSDYFMYRYETTVSVHMAYMNSLQSTMWHGTLVYIHFTILAYV